MGGNTRRPGDAASFRVAPGWGRVCKGGGRGTVGAGEGGGGVFGITSNTLVQFSRSSSGPAVGASDGYGLGRAAGVPDRRSTTTATRALRVIV